MNAKVEAEVNAGQMVMFAGAAMATMDPSITKVFAVTPGSKVAKDGRVLHSEKLGMGKRTEIAKALELVGKANKPMLDAKIMEVRDELMRGMKGKIASLDEDWTFKTGVRKDLANGNETLQVTFERINRAKTAVELETMAKAFGCTVKEVIAKLEAQRQKEAADTAKPANVTPTAPAAQLPPPVPETPTAEELAESAKADREAAEAEALNV